MAEVSESNVKRGFLARWGFPLAAGVLIAAGSYGFLASRAPAAAEATPPVAAARGSSFSAPPTKEAPPADPVGKAEAQGTPAPVPVAVLEPAATDPRAAEKSPTPAASDSPSAPVAAAEPKKPVAPAPVPKAEVKPAEAKADPAEGKALIVPFSKLAVRYSPQTPGGRDPFPAEIRKLDGRKVIIDGFMMPIDFDKGKVRTFLLTRSMMGCCYADSFGITDIIKVQPADGKTVSFSQMVRVTGTLEVGEEKDSEGYIESVYRIKSDEVAPAIFGR